MPLVNPPVPSASLAPHEDLIDFRNYYAADYRHAAGVRQIEALNAALSQPGERFGARIANGFAAFEAAAADAGGDTCAAGLRIKLPAGGCDAHPSTLGQNLLASAVVAVVRDPSTMRQTV